ncbi:MAG: type II secretion system F family protein [Rhodospirillales bacterium]
MSELFEFLSSIDPEVRLALSAGFAALVTVLAVWNALLVRDPMAGRLKTLRSHREAIRSDLLAPRGHRARKLLAMGAMHGFIDRLNLLRSAQAAKTSTRLAQAGWRSKDALVTYFFLKISLPFVFGGLALLFLYGSQAMTVPPFAKAPIAMLAVIIGAYLPEVLIANAVQKRRAQLQKGLPDALDLLVICVEAGLGLDAALNRVADEMGRSYPEIADEFALTAIELGFLNERRQALVNLMKRADIPSIRGVVNTLMQTEKYGTPLAQSLRVLSSEFRSERMMKAEEKAAKLPATLTVPLVVFIMPALFVVLLGPAVLRAMDALSSRF